MTMRVFIFGAGYSAQAFARSFAREAEWIGGTTRSPAKFEALAATGMQPFQFAGEITPAIADALATTTHLVVSAGPDEAGDPVVRAAADHIAHHMPALRWIGYLSTVGVYGNHQGAWIDETAECRPRAGRSDNRREAEKEWEALAGRCGHPLAILRLSGIYGPRRNAFVNIANGSARRIIKKDQVFNRIHVADIAGSLAHLVRNDIAGIFNVTDDEPAPPQDVVEFAAGLMNAPLPPAIDFETADLSPMARSFYGENKRVSNAKLKAAGYAFAYPDYRTAFTRMWREDDWRG